MKLKEALKRIEELERQVRELQAQPKQEFHYHYHQPAPIYVPQPWYVPVYPVQPWYPTWGAIGGSSCDSLSWNGGGPGAGAPGVAMAINPNASYGPDN